MITTEKVCKLIATLDANEKRYFRALIGRQEKSKPQYLLLFDLIAENIGIDENGEACCMLDEAGLIVRLRRRKVPENQFHVVRYNLTHALLKALRLKQEELSSESLIKNQLVNAKVLEHRGLSDWASEMAEEALHTARKFEYHGLAIEALQTLVYFRSQQNARGYAEQTRAYLDDLQQVIRQFEAEVLLFSLWHQAFILYRTGIGSMSVDLKKDVEQLLHHPALVEAAVPDSFLGKIYSLQARAVLADLQGGQQAAQPWFARIMELWEAPEYRHYQQERPRMFSIHLANYLVFCIAIKDFAGYKRYIGTLENIKADNSDLEAELFQNLRFIQILYYLNTNQLEIAQKLVPTVERGIKKYAFKINNSRLFALRVNIILVFFAAGEYKKALQHCAVLQQYGKSEQRRDVQLFTNILRHISHFELEEIDALESFVRKYKTNLSPASNFVPDFERIALTHLVQLADAYLKSTPGSEARRVKSAALFAEFQTALQKFRESNPPQIPLGTTETELWVKSKLAGKPFREMLME